MYCILFLCRSESCLPRGAAATLSTNRSGVCSSPTQSPEANNLKRSALEILPSGARSVRALITHPVLSGKAYENIENSVLEELIVCDTIPLKQESPKIKIISVADLFAIAIRNAYENKSITSLFIHSQLRGRDK